MIPFEEMQREKKMYLTIISLDHPLLAMTTELTLPIIFIFFMTNRPKILCYHLEG